MYAAQIAGPAAILSWFIGGFIAIILALVYAELGGMIPVEGVLHAYRISLTEQSTVLWPGGFAG